VPAARLFEYDVFLSYSSADADWVLAELLPRLEAVGLLVCVGSRDFRPGAPVATEIERAIVTSRKTLVVLTPAYLAEAWTEFEGLLLQTLDPANRERRLIPLVKEPCALPLRLRYPHPVDFFAPDDWQWAWTQLLTALGAPPEPPAPPQPTRERWYLAHPYPMPPHFTGRVAERALLTDWLTADAAHPLLVLRALGGFGKSALAWHWLLNDVDPVAWPRVVWWSLSEGDASFERFMAATLNYVSGATQVTFASQLGPRQQLDALLAALRRPGILLILDGFERALRAFGGLDAAYRSDVGASDPPVTAEARPPKAAQPEPSGGPLGGRERACLSPLADAFLRAVASLPGIRAKVLLTTRLRPVGVESHGGVLLQGCRELELTEMAPADAVAFFRAQGIRGGRAEIEGACASYGYHPLSLRLLAGLVVQDLIVPGDIAAAQRLEVSEDMAWCQRHVLQEAYDNLTPRRQGLLSRIACFRSAVGYDALRAAAESLPDEAVAADAVDADLRDLAMRGLLHQDRERGRFDLHPIVRRYAYGRLAKPERTATHTRLRDYFAAVPLADPPLSLDDLAPAIERYHHTVCAGEYDAARDLFQAQIHDPVFYRFGAYGLCIDLLRALFPRGEELPRLADERLQAWTLVALGNAYSFSGQPRLAVPAYELAVQLAARAGTTGDVATILGNLADDQLKLGALRAAESSLRRSIALAAELEDQTWQAIGLQFLGRVLACRGAWHESMLALVQAKMLAGLVGNSQIEGVVAAYSARRCLWMGAAAEALAEAQQARQLAAQSQLLIGTVARDLVHADWILGAAQRAAGNPVEAERCLQAALEGCRRTNMVDLEADILIDLARLRADLGNPEEANSLAEEALALAERCSYVLQEADARLVLAGLAMAGGDRAAARAHAQEAQRLARCDGPPDHTYAAAYAAAEDLVKLG